MSKKNNSGYYGESKVVSDTHYTLGPKILMTNIDCLEYKTMPDGKIVFVALIDYKNGTENNSQTISMRHSAMQAQLSLANTLNLPMFITLTYLDPEKYDIPMYYVIPVNSLAKKIFTDREVKDVGKWFSVLDYSRFQHMLRAITPRGIDINGLSSARREYKLPKIDIG